ncbi:MAG: glyoxylate/hydroxypyruvate reductase A [Alphaproteobacteria bacterium]|mgnify:CR=1 FL=1|nr:glyoxylate/hydroxypyruvate reductase A [Alphaproteobacteria bacterium]MDP6515925.1 glyoxylate/hydroxypyruvate reductase A [Alphaproteobacteria bacterium]
MALLFVSDDDDPVAWGRALWRLDPALDYRVWPEVGATGDIEAALVWRPPAGILAGLPNLALIQSLGAGIDHIFSDPDLPASVPVARLVDAELTRQMVEYVALAVLSRHRRIDAFRSFQRDAEWRVLRPVPVAESRVGVLGLGQIGAAVARALVGFGLEVSGWSRTGKHIAGVESFHGPKGLVPLLARSDILVCLLPLTPRTGGLLDARRLAALPPGAYVINAARGEMVVEEDLLAAIDAGAVSGAWLDVFRTEPLPADHRFWSHPAITMTPHVAGLTVPETAAAQVIENLERVRRGEPPRNRVDLAAGY